MLTTYAMLQESCKFTLSKGNVFGRVIIKFYLLSIIPQLLNTIAQGGYRFVDEFPLLRWDLLIVSLTTGQISDSEQPTQVVRHPDGFDIELRIITYLLF